MIKIFYMFVSFSVSAAARTLHISLLISSSMVTISGEIVILESSTVEPLEIGSEYRWLGLYIAVPRVFVIYSYRGIVMFCTDSLDYFCIYNYN